MVNPLRNAQSRIAGDLKGYEQRALASLEAKQFEATNAFTPSDQGGYGNLMGQSTKTQSYQHFRHWVYCAVNSIAIRLSSQKVMAGSILNAPENPERTLQRVGNKQLQRAYDKQKAAAIEQLGLKHNIGNDIELLATHPILDALERPNDIQKKGEFLWLSTVNLLVTGVNYWIGGVNKDRPQGIELWCVPSTWITPEHNGGLFTGYKMQPSGAAEPVHLEPESVARTYFPNPSDLKGVMSPLQAISEAIRVDEHIQQSQAAAFERGVNPNVIITVGKTKGPDGSVQDRRPTLTGAARRAMTLAVRELWNQTVGNGDPAIIDGLIESVHKLQNTPAEMDWMQSGESVKRRIMQAYHVNPIALGEVTAGNRAQAIEAEKNFCSMAVNPIITKFSESLTDFVGPLYEKPKRLVVWIDKCSPEDTAERDQLWLSAASANHITRDEFRSEILGLPPDDRREKSPLMNLVGGVGAASTLLTQVGQGLISKSQASTLLQAFFDMESTLADQLAGIGEQDIGQPQDAPPPIEQSREDVDQIEAGDEIVDDDAQDAVELQEIGKSYANKILNREDVKSISRNQSDRIREEVSGRLAEFFRNQIEETAKRVGQLDAIPAGSPQEAASRTMALVYDQDEWNVAFVKSSIPGLVAAFEEGMTTQLLLHTMLHDNAVSKSASNLLGLKTTAQDLADRLGIELPENFGLNVPEWAMEQAILALEEIVETEWYRQIPVTTAYDIQATLESGIRDGLSTQKLSKMLQVTRGPSYAKWRANAFARTEVGHMLNAGHAAGVRQLQEETGLPMGLEWMSIFGPTTRDSHAHADGQQISEDPNARFVVGGHECRWPSDTSLPAGERINCQCTVMSALLFDKPVEMPGPVPPGGATTDLGSWEPPEIEGYTPVNPYAKETFDRYKDDKGNWTPEREALHERIREEVIGDSGKSDDPTVYMMGGGPASGKGSIQKHGLVTLPEGIPHVDPDEIKKLIPDYVEMNDKRKDTRAAAYAHEESSMLAKDVVARRVETGGDVFLDGTGDGGFEKLQKKVDGYRKNGHKVKAQYVTVDTEEAIKRSDQRGQRSGRFVPHDYIRSVHGSISRDFPKAVEAGLFDEVQLWDNNGVAGSKPTLVVDYVKNRKGGDDLIIKDPHKYERFLMKNPDYKPQDKARPWQAPKLDNFPVGNEDGADTFERYKDKKGDWTKERKSLHGEIEDKYVGRGFKTVEPTVYMMGGGPASGKGSVTRAGLVKIPDSAVAIDPDELKKDIPDYNVLVDKKDSKAAAFAHEESSYLGKSITKKLLDKDADVFLDGVNDGGIEKVRQKVAGYRAKGHKIKAHYVTVDTEEAVRRSNLRGERSGRFVPEDYIREAHQAVSDIVPKAIDEGLFDELDLYDNNAKEPKRILSYKKGRKDGRDLIVDDPIAWEEFKKKSPNYKPKKIEDAKTLEEVDSLLDDMGVQGNFSKAAGFTDADEAEARRISAKKYTTFSDPIEVEKKRAFVEEFVKLKKEFPEVPVKALGTAYHMNRNKWQYNFEMNIEADKKSYTGKRWRRAEAEKRVRKIMVKEPGWGPPPPLHDPGTLGYMDHKHRSGVHVSNEVDEFDRTQKRRADEGFGIAMNHQGGLIKTEEQDDADRQKYFKRHAEGRKYSYLSVIATNPKGLMKHEFMHAIDYHFEIHKDQRVVELWNKWKKSDDLKYQLSSYSETNIHEFLSEGFAEGSRKDSRPLGKEIKSLVDKIVEEKRAKS